MEHILVYCDANDIDHIPQGYVVHHIDEDKLNNDYTNLELLTRAEHIRVHKVNRWIT